MIEIDITFEGTDEETLVSRADEMNVVACTFDALGKYWFIGQNSLRYTDCANSVISGLPKVKDKYQNTSKIVSNILLLRGPKNGNHECTHYISYFKFEL